MDIALTNENINKYIFKDTVRLNKKITVNKLEDLLSEADIVYPENDMIRYFLKLSKVKVIKTLIYNHRPYVQVCIDNSMWWFPFMTEIFLPVCIELQKIPEEVINLI